MRVFPRVVVGCLLLWSATAASSLHARGTNSGSATLILTDGQANGSLSIGGGSYTSFSGGAITGATSLTIYTQLPGGSLSTVGSFTKTGTGDITLTAVSGAAGAFTVNDGVTFASTGTVNLGSGSAVSFGGTLDGGALSSGLTFNSGSVLITNGASTINSTATISLANSSLLTANGVLTLAPGSVINTGGTVTGGTNSLVTGGLVTFGSGAAINAGGTLSLGTGSILTPPVVNVTTGTITGGTLSLSSGTVTLGSITTTIGGSGELKLANSGNFGAITIQAAPGLAPSLLANGYTTFNVTSTNINAAGQFLLTGSNPLNFNMGPDTLALLGKLPVVKDGAPGSSGTGAKFLDGVLTNTGTISLLYLPAALNLASDPLSLHFSSPAMHDKFVLQMSFNPTTAGLLGDISKLYLAWFDPSDGTWKNAVDGDSDGGASAHFVLGAYDPTVDFNLGWYGVDTTNNTVWAVVNHNSIFSVANSDVAPSSTTTDGTSFLTFAEVPEPSSLALLFGGLGLFARRSRRK